MWSARSWAGCDVRAVLFAQAVLFLEIASQKLNFNKDHKKSSLCDGAYLHLLPTNYMC